MIYGCARVWTDGQSVEAQIAALTAAGAVKVFREVASGAKAEAIRRREAGEETLAEIGRSYNVSGADDSRADHTIF